DLDERLEDCETGITSLSSIIASVEEAKADKEYNASAGTDLAFTKNAVYGLEGAPETGNVTFNAAGAKRGVRVILIHQNGGGEPTYDAAMKKYSNSAAYDPSKLNIYEFVCINNGLVYFRINHD